MLFFNRIKCKITSTSISYINVNAETLTYKNHKRFCLY